MWTSMLGVGLLFLMLGLTLKWASNQALKDSLVFIKRLREMLVLEIQQKEIAQHNLGNALDRIIALEKLVKLKEKELAGERKVRLVQEGIEMDKNEESR